MERAVETYEEVTKDLNLPMSEVKKYSKKLLHNVYVNDSMTGGTRKEVNGMIRVKLSDGSFSRTIPSIMKKVCLKLKTIVTSHSSNQESLTKFWVIYDAIKDLIGVKFIFNPAKKIKGVHLKPDLTLKDVEGFMKLPQT